MSHDLKLFFILSDADTANGNPTDVTKTETAKEDINKNEKVVKNSKNTSKKSGNKMANNETNVKEAESFENGKDETDNLSNVEVMQEEQLSKSEETVTKALAAEKSEVPVPSPAVVPKYNYNPGLYLFLYDVLPSHYNCVFDMLLLIFFVFCAGQWSPFNKTGKKCYDIGLLKQMKDDPLSKNKPNVPLLEACNVMRVCIVLISRFSISYVYELLFLI